MTAAKAKAKTEPVRQKASHRKGRTDEVRHEPRVPTQERSRRRYQAIIEATIHLLETANIEDISLYDIAKESKIAPPSVHYLFSTVAAVHVELNRIYNESLTEKIVDVNRSMFASGNPSWQDWVREAMTAGRNLLNANRPMSEIMLGPSLHRKSRATNLATNASFAKTVLEIMQQRFVMPEIPHLERCFTFAAEIADALWSGSYSAYATIDDITFNESVRANIAYLRCFLPDTLMLREVSTA